MHLDGMKPGRQESRREHCKISFEVCISMQCSHDFLSMTESRLNTVVQGTAITCESVLSIPVF